MVNRKDFTPAILSLLLVMGVLILAAVRPFRMPGLRVACTVNLDIVFVGLYLLWLAVETPIARRDVSTEGKQTSDSATCQLYASAQALTFLSALWSPPIWQAPNVAHFLGMGLSLLGVACRLWAIRTLGGFYSHRVRTVTEHRIVASGPYHLIRHPAYAGMIVANVGVSLYFLNGVTLCLFLFALIPAIVLRIVIEERMLFGIDGYADYAKNRKRLLPGIW